MLEEMKDSGIGGLEAHQPQAQLQFNSIKPPPLTTAAATAATTGIPPIIPAPPVTMDSKAGSSKTATWNTKNLPFRLGADLISAASAAVLVAPIISIIDR